MSTLLRPYQVIIPLIRHAIRAPQFLYPWTGERSTIVQRCTKYHRTADDFSLPPVMDQIGPESFGWDYDDEWIDERITGMSRTEFRDFLFYEYAYNLNCIEARELGEAQINAYIDGYNALRARYLSLPEPMLMDEPQKE